MIGSLIFVVIKSYCWQIGGLAASINSPCVRRGRLKSKPEFTNYEYEQNCQLNKVP